MNYIEEETLVSVSIKLNEFAKQLHQDYGTTEDQFYSVLAALLSSKIARVGNMDTSMMLCANFMRITLSKTSQIIDKQKT